MTDNKYRKYEPFFGKWYISKEVGKGAFGRVFEIYWDDTLGGHSTSALKIIHIPSDEALLTQKELQGGNLENVRIYFLRQVDRIKDEVRILQKCKGHSNIVSYEDHMIIENGDEDGIGWDILIRMELLYPLGLHFDRKEASQYDIIRMWRDITNALIFCEEEGIIHRDIKPANILISQTGNYKLSDFGVARKNLQQDNLASTRVGTEKYMAPEVYKNQKYDKRADYYSLGCVMYYFLNRRRHPFYPQYPQKIEQEDVFAAENKLRSGEKILPIKGVSKEVNDILLKAMSYNPSRRFKNAREMYQAIQAVLNRQEYELRNKYINADNIDISERMSAGTGTVKKQKSGYSLFPAVIAGVMLMAGIIGIWYGMYFMEDLNRKSMTRLTEQMHTNDSHDHEQIDPAQTDHEQISQKQSDMKNEIYEESETEIPLPTTRLLGDMERPVDGDIIGTSIKMKGWILTSDEVGGMEIYGDILADGEVIQSSEIAYSELGENIYEKRQRKNADRISACDGYELKGTHLVKDIPEGTYIYNLRVVDTETRKEEVIDSAEIKISNKRTQNVRSIMEMINAEEETQIRDISYILGEKGYALGLDVKDAETLITANPEQILLTGWINAPDDTSLGMFLEIDDQLYTADALAELGGSMELIRVPRYLEKMNPKLIGNLVQNMEEAGYVINLRMPFLDDGEHIIVLAFNIGLPGENPEIIDMAPLTIQTSASEQIEKGKAERVISEWNLEFPQSETELTAS